MDKRIVIIEDDEIIRECLSIVLEGEGLEVVAAVNGREGVDLVRQHRPDLVLSDLHMAEFSGMQVIEAVRTDPATAHIPLVVVSADSSPSVRQQCRGYGVDAFLLKPFNPADLVETVRGLLMRSSP